MTELIAKEREKAAAKAAEKKRPAEAAEPEGTTPDARETTSKRPKRSGGKKRK